MKIILKLFKVKIKIKKNKITFNKQNFFLINFKNYYYLFIYFTPFSPYHCPYLSPTLTGPGS